VSPGKQHEGVESRATTKRPGTAETARARHQEAIPDATPTLQALHGLDVMRDKRYQQSKLGREVVDFLAWLELGGAAPRTLDQYERDLSRGCLMFPNHSLAEWTDAELLHVAKSFKPGERRVRVAAWRSFFKWARQTRRITENPTETLPTIRRTPQKVIDVFSEAEVEALLGLPLVDAAPLGILFEAGLRKAEARNLQLRHCAPELGRVIVIGGKGNKDRIIPMSARLRSLLADLALTEALTPSDYIFYRVYANEIASKKAREKPVGEGTFARWWRRCIEEAGVRYRVPHTARHTFATRWRRRGLAVDEIQLLLGHASIRTTSDLYVHTEIEDVAARMAELEVAT
jgi:integrase/recombinase XerD